MECATSKVAINHTLKTVSDISYSEKTSSFLIESDIDRFLDNVLEFNKLISAKIARVKEINGLLEKISWLDDLNNDCLKRLNALIGIGRDFHATLMKQYTVLEIIKSHDIGTDKIEDFKECM